MYAGEKGRIQYHNNPEKCAERKKQFKENNPEKYKEQRTNGSDTQKEKTFHVVMVCPICHYSIKKYKKTQHKKSLSTRPCPSSALHKLG